MNMTYLIYKLFRLFDFFKLQSHNRTQNHIFVAKTSEHISKIAKVQYNLEKWNKAKCLAPNNQNC